MSRQPTDEQLISEIAEASARELKRLLYPREYFEKMRQLRTSTEKLVYLYVWLTQPQTFSGVKRGLGISRDAAAKALKKLVTIGLVTRDGFLLYWTAEEVKRGPLKGEAFLSR